MSKQQAQERQSRKPKPENRFVSFLSRSRSRSRTKDVRIGGTGSSRDAPSNTVLPNSKPPARITSRPISTTTTATNATVVPGTPKARTRPVPAIPVPQPSESIGPDQQMYPGPSIPKPPGARRKLHNLFGIHLAGPKKSAFSATISQPGSSRSSFDVPPMPTQPASLGSNFKHKGTSPRSQSPGTKVGHKATTSLTDISNVQCPAPSANMFHKFFSGSKGPQTDTVLPVSVSAPIRRPSQHRSTKSDGKPHLTDKPLPEPGSTASVSGPSLLPPPQIIYTPATPERPTSSSSPSRHVKKVSLRLSKRSRSTDAKGKGRATHQNLASDDPTRSTSHGVFDFENPPFNVGTFSIQRSDSGGTDGFSSMSAWNQRTARAIPERDSTFGPGLAGLGTIQREMSLRRGQEWEEQLRVRETERKKLLQEQRKQRHEQSSSQNTTPAETDHAGGSTSTVGTGHSSSWGKSAGKRAAMSVKTGSGSGLPKMTTLTHHPAFDFEPPVPSSNSWSTSSLGMLHDTVTSPPSGEKRGTGKWQQKPCSSEERRPSPSPAPPPIGHRSALKGRSLDLGLGLAWAPSTMREDALLPLLNLGRTFSHSSGDKSASDSHTGKSTSTSNGTKARNEDASQLGKEIAAVFKSTLDRDGFANFKRYVHQFDAHEIPFDGPTGIISRVEQLLGESSTLKQHEKRELMDQLVRIILRNA